MRFGFGVLLGIILLAQGIANEAIPMSVVQLTQRAELVVRGKVEGKSVLRDGEGRIYTEVKLAVTEVWKGDPKKPLVRVVHGGGILGEQKVTALGQVAYEVGEEVVGFFVWNQRGEAVTLSMSQGKFLLKRAEAGKVEVSNPFHGGKAKALMLDDLKTRVKESLR